MKKLILITVTLLGSILTMNAQNWSGLTPGNIYYNQGNVGIGTSDPQVKMHVDDVNANNELLRLDNGGLRYTSFINYSDGTYDNAGLQLKKWSSVGQFKFSNSNGDLMTILSDGNVGIGTASPQAKLHIRNYDTDATYPSLTSRGDILQFYDVVNNSFEIGVGGASNTRRSWILSRHSDLSGTYGKYYSTLHLQPDIGDKSQYRGLAIGYPTSTHVDVGTHLAINGNVGIGTVSPNYQLHIKDGSGLRVQASNAQIVFSDVSNSLKLRMNNSGDLQLTDISNNSLLHFDNNGNMGIGIINPPSKLTVQTGYITLIDNSYDEWIFRKHRTDGTHNIGFKAHGASEMSIWAGVEAIRIKSNGNVGIGTVETGTHKLAVEGTIGAREIIVEADGWSDFVFNKEYKLKDLREVESFIEENNHLPDIPSEKEVVENGIQVGEMNTKLLQKIEELTLYMIDINKEVKALKSENEILKNEINTLKTQ